MHSQLACAVAGHILYYPWNPSLCRFEFVNSFSLLLLVHAHLTCGLFQFYLGKLVWNFKAFLRFGPTPFCI